MTESYPNGYKTLREKEKLLVTSSFSFSYSVFERPVMQTCKNQGLFGKGNSLNNDTFLDWSKLITFADDKIILNKKLKFVLERIENNVRKRRIC